MKNLKKILLSFNFLLLFLLFSSISVKAESSQWKFVGEITPKHEFFIGDVLSVDDFNVDGFLTDGKDRYYLDDLDVIPVQKQKYMEKENGKWVVKTRDTTSTVGEKNIAVNIYLKNDLLLRDILTVKIKVNDFSPKVTNSLSNKIVKVSSLYILNNLKCNAINDNGVKINGKLKINDSNYLEYGYSVKDFEFTPNDSRYNIVKGNFVVNYIKKPSITVTENSIKIGLSNASKRYKIKLDGKVYTETTIKGLNSNTEYNLEIIQKNLPSIVLNKNVTNVLYSNKIKTK